MLGIDASWYYNSGTYGSPTWVEATCIGDAAVNAAYDWAEVMSRASRVKLGAKTMLGLDFPCKLLGKFSGDTAYEYLRDALISDLIVDFLCLNGPNTQVGAWGWRFHGQVLQANQSQNPGDRIMDDIVIRPCVPSDTNYPKYAEVTTGPAVTLTAVGTAPS